MKTVRVHVAAGEGVEDARRAVEDVLEMLNGHFRDRGVEFVAAGEGGGDWTIALYWKDFGGMGREEFETVYEEFKKEKKPVIHVFFKEPDAGIADALKAFKGAFAEKYGHFYCHFETVDAVRFQLVSQGLWLLPGTGATGERDALKVEEGVVRLENEPVARMENLPFAKLNKRRKLLVTKIADAEKRVAELEEDSATSDDEETAELLREARVERHNLKEELKQYDGFLFDVAVEFAKTMAEETSERMRKAWALFQEGKVQEANKLLDWDLLKESAERNRTLFRAQRKAFEKNLQEYLTKATIVMADDSMTMTERVDAASRAYDEAIAIAKEIEWDQEKLAEILLKYAVLLQKQGRVQSSLNLYTDALGIWRSLVIQNHKSYDANLGIVLNNIGILHDNLQCVDVAEKEYKEALEIYRRLALDNPKTYEPSVTMVLNNLGVLHKGEQRFDEAEKEYRESLAILRHLAIANPDAYAHDIAMTLSNLANLHDDAQRFCEAEKEYEEALALCRPLAKEKPHVHEPYLATILHNLASSHKDTNRLAEAEKEFQEAASIRRRLAAENPEVYEKTLAKTLYFLGLLYQDDHREGEAEDAYVEALRIYRRLAEIDSARYEAWYAMTLSTLANLKSTTGRLNEAEKDCEEALEIYWRLAGTNPEVHEKQLDLTIIHVVSVLETGGHIQEAQWLMKDLMRMYLRCYKRTSRRRFLWRCLECGGTIWLMSPMKRWTLRIGCFGLLVLVLCAIVWMIVSCFA